MTATRELWMLFGTFVLSVLFVCFFIVPNYKSADQASIEGSFLEARIQKLELRQAEVEKMRIDYEDIKQQKQKKQIYARAYFFYVRPWPWEFF